MRKILFYGDSNTWGFDPADCLTGRYPAAVRWTASLKTALAPGWEVYADGMNGRRIPAGEAALERMRNTLEQIRPDVLFLMLGSNDVLFSYPPQEDAILAYTEEAMRDLLRFLTAHDPVSGGSSGKTAEPENDISAAVSEKNKAPSAFTEEASARPPRIILASIPRMETGIPDFDDAARKLRSVYRKLAADFGAGWADPFGWEIGLGSDGVHFSEDGHRTFAGHLIQALAGFGIRS